MAPSYIISSAKNLKILSTLFRSRDNHLPYNRRLGFRSTTSGNFSLNPITDRRVCNQSSHCSKVEAKIQSNENFEVKLQNVFPESGHLDNQRFRFKRW
ncbi:hypothetical protein HRI_002140700 [Hibiscus trionum]|uniref:Uncharacterized protein n=1 Tax=Hibiscus trionum TaxID=183268 RepID=A0A9W7HW34_HIBTR|nr:hypothetical protein HRI_002140700 [Hibiscus trionum]